MVSLFILISVKSKKFLFYYEIMRKKTHVARNVFRAWTRSHNFVNNQFVTISRNNDVEKLMLVHLTEYYDLSRCSHGTSHEEPLRHHH